MAIDVKRALIFIGCAATMTPLPLSEEAKAKAAEKKGSLKIPKDASDVIKNLITDVVDDMMVRIVNLHVTMTPEIGNFIERFEEKMFFEMKELISAWKKEPPTFKARDAVEEAWGEIARAFHHLKAKFPNNELPLERNLEIAINDASEVMAERMTPIIRGWAIK